MGVRTIDKYGGDQLANNSGSNNEASVPCAPFENSLINTSVRVLSILKNRAQAFVSRSRDRKRIRVADLDCLDILNTVSNNSLALVQG